jgi:hypothetical protein
VSLRKLAFRLGCLDRCARPAWMLTCDAPPTRVQAVTPRPQLRAQTQQRMALLAAANRLGFTGDHGE